MAAGLPVVNTSLSTAVPNVARHAREGLTVQPGDPAALADAVNKLLSNKDLADSYGQAGQIRAISEFDQEIYRTKIEQIFAEAVQRRQG
jgi:rhamnosyl/mannosyltransferase